MRWFYTFLFLFTFLFGGWMAYNKLDWQSEPDVEVVLPSLIQGQLENALPYLYRFDPNIEKAVLQVNFNAGHQYQFSQNHPSWQLLNALDYRLKSAAAQSPYAGIEVTKLYLTADELVIQVAASAGREREMAQLISNALLQGPATEQEQRLRRHQSGVQTNTATIDPQLWFNAYINANSARISLFSNVPQLDQQLTAFTALPQKAAQQSVNRQFSAGVVKSNGQNQLRIYFDAALHPLTQLQLQSQLASEHEKGLIKAFYAAFSAQLNPIVYPDYLAFDLQEKASINTQVALIFAYLNELAANPQVLMRSQEQFIAWGAVPTNLQQASIIYQQSSPLQKDAKLLDVLAGLSPAKAMVLQADAEQDFKAFGTAQLSQWQAASNPKLSLANDALLAQPKANLAQVNLVENALFSAQPDYLVHTKQLKILSLANQEAKNAYINAQVSLADAKAVYQTLAEQRAMMSNSLFAAGAKFDLKLAGNDLEVQIAAPFNLASELNLLLTETLLAGSVEDAKLFIFGAVQGVEAQMAKPWQALSFAESAQNSTSQWQAGVSVQSNDWQHQLVWQLPVANELDDVAIYQSMAQQLEQGLVEYFVFNRQVASDVQLLINEQQLQIVVTSADTNPGLLELHLRKALLQQVERLKTMDLADYSQVNLLSAQTIAAQNNFVDELNQRYWQNIKHDFKHFNQATLSAIALERLSKDQLVKYLEQLVEVNADILVVHQAKAGSDYQIGEFLDGRRLLN